MSKPWLSVLMPVYNGEKYLAQALDSVVAQGDNGIECIAVDDGSPDSTLEILNHYKDKLPLKMIQRPHGGNWAANTNIALSEAQGDYACILHQDDMWLEGRLQTLKGLIAQYPEANMILHPSWFIDDKEKRLGLWQCPLPAYPAEISAELMIERLLIQNFISIVAPVFKREMALKIGGLDEKLWFTPDWDFWLKMSSRGKIVYYPKPLSAFRIQQKTQTITRSVNIQDFRNEIEKVFERNFKDWNAPGKIRSLAQKAALFSIEMNVFLASILHKKKIKLFKLMLCFIRLGPAGWYRYFRNSRIIERVLARLRANL